MVLANPAAESPSLLSPRWVRLQRRDQGNGRGPHCSQHERGVTNKGGAGRGDGAVASGQEATLDTRDDWVNPGGWGPALALFAGTASSLPGQSSALTM